MRFWKVMLSVLLVILAVLFISFQEDIPAKDFDSLSFQNDSPPNDFGVDDNRSVYDRLQSLGYVGVYDVEGEPSEGVTFYGRRDEVEPGYIAYASMLTNRSFLVDLDGNVVHTWTVPADFTKLIHVEVMPDCSAYIISENKGVYKLDRDSNVLLRIDMLSHHDLEVLPDGNIMVLGRRLKNLTQKGKLKTIVEDLIMFYSPDGVSLKNISLYRMFRSMIPRRRIAVIPSNDSVFKKNGFGIRKIHDPLHTNTVEYLRKDIPGIAKRGALLISMRYLDTIAIIDPETEKILWKWGKGELSDQHRPTLLDDGTILVFDNGLDSRKSRVVVVDPKTSNITRQFSVPFSGSMGGAQLLENKNLLVTVATSGKVIEYTPDGKPVWEYTHFEKQSSENRTQQVGIYYAHKLIENPCV